MKNSEVVKLYNMLGKEPESNEDILYDIESIARKNREEFCYLVKLFNKEDIIKRHVTKNLLSTVLRNLNYEPVKDYYLDIIANNPDMDDRAEAAIDMIRMNDQRGVNALKKTLSSVEDDFQREWIEALVEIDSIMSLQLFLYLADREQIYAYDFWQRDQVETRLAELLKNPNP